MKEKNDKYMADQASRLKQKEKKLKSQEAKLAQEKENHRIALEKFVLIQHDHSKSKSTTEGNNNSLQVTVERTHSRKNSSTSSDGGQKARRNQDNQTLEIEYNKSLVKIDELEKEIQSLQKKMVEHERTLQKTGRSVVMSSIDASGSYRIEITSVYLKNIVPPNSNSPTTFLEIHYNRDVFPFEMKKKDHSPKWSEKIKIDLVKNFQKELPTFTIKVHTKNILLFEIAAVEVNLNELLENPNPVKDLVLTTKKNRQKKDEEDMEIGLSVRFIKNY